MLALIAVIIAAILLLPSCGSRGGKAEADTESTTLVKAGDKAPDFTVDYIPRNFLIGADGKVVLATVGYDAEEFDEMIKTIEKILE